jgi:OOP family OmpA-OmpF porin
MEIVDGADVALAAGILADGSPEAGPGPGTEFDGVNASRCLWRFAALGVALGSLLGCATHVSEGIGDDGRAQKVIFPSIDQATRREGTFPDRNMLHDAAPGLRKSQLLQWFGPPHFNEGLAGVREWDYIFHFYSGGGVTTCRYKVIFDRAYTAQSFHWRPAECGEWLAPEAPVQARTEAGR